MPASASQTTPDGLKLEQFGGMLPAWDDHLIPQGQGSFAQNCYLFSGALEGWRTPKLLYTLKNSAAKFAYRLPLTSQNIANAILYFANNPAPGATVLLGEETYTFVGAVAKAYDVKIGATAAVTATNFFAAITLDNGKNTNVGTLYGVGTVANPAINQAAPVTTNVLATDVPRVQVFAPTSGAAYNNTLVASSTATDLPWKYNNVATTSFQGGTNLTFDASITGASTWIEFVDPDTDVMRSPVVNDSFDRFYFASPSLAPQYNTRKRIEAGLPAWLLGVPAPGCSPGVTVAGGGSAAVLGSLTTANFANASPGANIIYLRPFTPDGAEILNDVNFLPFQTNATAKYVGLLFDDLNGSPHNLINVGSQGIGVTTATTAASAFQNPTGLLRNVQYWIGYATDTAFSVQYADDQTKMSGVVSLNTYANGQPAVINNLTVGYPNLQVWGNATSSAVQEARSYVYTYITEYDEESPPSPATILTGWSNATWTIALNTPPPDQLGQVRDITKLRIYRTVTATGGNTTYFQVTGTIAANGTGGVDLPVTTATFVDNITDDVIVAYNQLQSQLWFPPPADLQGMVSMPNGMAVGFRANEIWFSEPYRPHAWPPSYVLTTEYPIVGLGVTGNSVVACTTGSPYIATGTSPASMSALKVQHSEPCHSRGSILGNNDGVYYASTNGLILVTQYGAVTNTTEMWITREKWQALTPQKNMRAVFLVSSYYALGTVRNGDASVAQKGFTIELNNDDKQSFTIWPQPGGHRIGFNQLTGPNGLNVDNVRIDPWSSVALVMQAGAVYQFDFTDQASVMQTYDWRSKLFQQKSRKNFEAMRIWFTIPPGTPALNPTRISAVASDPIWNSLPADRYGFIKVYAGGNLVCCREIRTTQELMRIVSGFKSETWQWEIIARIKIANIQIGTSVKAMAKL